MKKKKKKLKHNPANAKFPTRTIGSWIGCLVPRSIVLPLDALFVTSKVDC
jgi:hypothetical protein